MQNQLRPFELEDLFRFQYLEEAQISPDGKRVVYVLKTTHAADEKEYAELWLSDLETGRQLQLTGGKWVDSAPAWSPNGEEIAFLSSRAGAPQIFKIRLAGGEARQLTTQPQGCLGPLLWSPDGAVIAFTSSPKTPLDRTKPYRLRRATIRFDGAGYVDTILRNICLLHLAQNTVEQLTDEDCDHTPTSWSPDGQELLVLTNFRPDSINYYSDIEAVAVSKARRKILTSGWYAINAKWLPDGRIAFIGHNAANFTVGEKANLWVMNPNGAEIECRTTAFPLGMGGSLHDDMPVHWSLGLPAMVISQDKENARPDILTTVQKGGSIELYRVATQGPEQVNLLASGERTCLPFSWAQNKVVFGVSTLFNPTQLAVLDTTSGQETQLTSLNQDLLAQIALPTLQNLHFASKDGAQVEGWVLTPASGQAPYPTILHIHGGPHTGYGHAFHFDFLTLTGAGYAVLLVNQRGSTGYGDEFATKIIGDWGNLDYADLMAGVDHLIALGTADPDRLGCCGVSGGGYLSTWIVGQTDRFKAAVPENPVTNWFSMYGTSDIGPQFTVWELGGKPHEVRDVYYRCSPIFYAHNCKTPTLLIQGEDDFRCPAGQSEEFYAVLKANGCTVEMLRNPASSHNDATYGSFAVRRAQNSALLEWMNKYGE